MASTWRWLGPEAAVAQGERYFLSVAKGSGSDEVYHVGDCVELASKNLAVVLALWESPEGVKSAEVRLFYREYQALALARRRNAAKATNVIGEAVYETDCIETVELAAFARKVAVLEGGLDETIDIAEFVAVGMLNTQTKRISPLTEGESRLKRSRALGPRARVMSVEEETKVEKVAAKKAKTKVEKQQPSHTGAKRPRETGQEKNEKSEPPAKRSLNDAKRSDALKSTGARSSPEIRQPANNACEKKSGSALTKEPPVVALEKRNENTLPRAKRSPAAEAANKKLQSACKELLLSSLPRVMTGREDERDEIYTALHSSIEQQSAGGPIYISGLPGAGKTSIVKEVIRKLERERDGGELRNFVWVEINGLQMPRPDVAYNVLWQALQSNNNSDNETAQGPTRKNISAARLCEFLQCEFHSKNAARPMLLVLLDEMDFMLAGKNQVLYNLLEWQTAATAKLVLVGIANTMDLPERLPSKIRSRLGGHRITFPAYTRAQLENIIQQRLLQLDIFSEEAIQICAKSLAHQSGDVRQALSLCRKAAEVCLQRLLDNDQSTARATDDSEYFVTGEDLHQAQEAVSVSAPLSRLRACSKFECTFLVALRMEVRAHAARNTGRGGVELEAVIERFAILCKTHSFVPIPRLRGLLFICDELERSGIIRQISTRTSRYPLLELCCSHQELQDTFLTHPVGMQLIS